mgnify:CR=1 FL=1
MIAKVLRVLHQLEDLILVVALLTMLLLAIMQIVMRNFFDGGFLSAESFVRILVLWIAMLGALVATREDNHINIDALTRFLPEIWRKVVSLINNVVAGAICFAVAYYAFELVGYEYEDRTIAFGDVPTWLCQSILPFGFGLMGLRFFVNGIKGLSG